MNRFVDDSIASLQRRVEVRNVLSEIVDDVSEWWHENEAYRFQVQLLESKRVAFTLAQRVQTLLEEKQGLQGEIEAIRARSKEVRSLFAVDIASILIESRSIQSLKQKVKDLELKLATRPPALKLEEKEPEAAIIDANAADDGNSATLASADASAVVVHAALAKDAPASEVNARPLPCILSDVNDAVLLGIFSYLHTGEVLAAAQVNRFVFQRVDGLFGIDSKIAVPAWKERYPGHNTETSVAGDDTTSKVGAAASASSELPSSAATTSSSASFVSAAGTISALASLAQATGKDKIQSLLAFIDGSSAGASPTALLLPKDLLDSLGKKLTASELKFITALNEGMRKQIADASKMSADKDDLSARLQNTETVRDFLVTKLRAAELALKAAMSEALKLRRQSLADGEVISYLDLRGQELEMQAQDCERTRQRLQTALTFQQGTFAHTERRLSQELQEARTYLEEGEASYKAQKKLLVKEVKSLRSQLEITTRERNIFAAQLRVVKDTLL